MLKLLYFVAAVTSETPVEDDFDFEIGDDEPQQPSEKSKKRRHREKPKNDDSAALEVDAALSEPERTLRMRTCLDLSRAKLADNDSIVAELVTKLTTGLVGAELSAEQALEYVNMDFVKNCYLSINQKEDLPAYKANAAAWRAANENRVLLPDENRAHIRTPNQSWP